MTFLDPSDPFKCQHFGIGGVVENAATEADVVNSHECYLRSLYGETRPHAEGCAAVFVPVVLWALRVRERTKGRLQHCIRCSPRLSVVSTSPCVALEPINSGALP